MIAERADSVGGHAEIQSTPGQGTAVTITVPLAPKPHELQKTGDTF
jgi:chemotaxis protein histidine kinase CheA